MALSTELWLSTWLDVEVFLHLGPWRNDERVWVAWMWLNGKYVWLWCSVRVFLYACICVCISIFVDLVLQSVASDNHCLTVILLWRSVPAPFAGTDTSWWSVPSAGCVCVCLDVYVYTTHTHAHVVCVCLCECAVCIRFSMRVCLCTFHSYTYRYSITSYISNLVPEQLSSLVRLYESPYDMYIPETFICLTRKRTLILYIVAMSKILVHLCSYFFYLEP